MKKHIAACACKLVRNTSALFLLFSCPVVTAGAVVTVGGPYSDNCFMSACAFADDDGERIVPLKMVDVKPAYPGGRDALARYVREWFANDSVEGVPVDFFKVRIRFVIEKDGSITSPRVVEGASPEVDKAVLAMIGAMPKWTPGQKDGKAVRTGYGTRLSVPDYSGRMQVKPAYPGGRTALMDYIHAALKKTDASKYDGEQVTVRARFTVKADGGIADAGIIEHGTEEMDEAVLAIVAGMPRWRPGTVGGEPVDMGFTLPVAFGKRTFDGEDNIPAGFPGGEELLHKYIQAKIRYPEMSHETRRSGRVVARFTVDKDGSIVEPVIVSHGTADMDAEILRFLKGMPKWNPAMRDGKPIRSRQTFTMDFNSRETAFTKYDPARRRDRWGDADGDGAGNVVYVIDGKEVTAYEIDNIDARTIKTFKTLKPREARKLYGDKAADGAIVVTTVEGE